MTDFLPEVDPFTGITTEYAYDEESKSLIMKRSQNVQEILDYNKALYNDPATDWRKSEDKFMLFARIPNLLIEKWLLEEGWFVLNAKMGRDGKPNDEMVRLLRRLESPDYRYLKTTPMRMA